jgi:hypothetical protein
LRQVSSDAVPVKRRLTAMILALHAPGQFMEQIDALRVNDREQ